MVVVLVVVAMQDIARLFILFLAAEESMDVAEATLSKVSTTIATVLDAVHAMGPIPIEKLVLPRASLQCEPILQANVQCVMILQSISRHRKCIECVCFRCCALQEILDGWPVAAPCAAKIGVAAALWVTGYCAWTMSYSKLMVGRMRSGTVWEKCQLNGSFATTVANIGCTTEQSLDDEHVEDEQAAGSQNDEHTTPLQEGANLLVQHYVGYVGKFRLSTDWLSAKHTLRRIQAAAEACLSGQQCVLEQVCALVGRMVRADCWEAIAFIHHIQYDETQQDIVLQFQGDSEADRQTAKVFVVEQSWAMLMRRHRAQMPLTDCSASDTEVFLLQGDFSPLVRGSESSTGETTAKVLQSCNMLPSSEALSPFKQCIRIVEVDDCPSNPRAESIILQDSPIAWTVLYFRCMAHKVHAAAQKSWGLQAKAVAGILHACKVLYGSGARSRLKDAAVALVAERLVLRHHEILDGPATRFRGVAQ
eukprot:6491084-Amphidinium_carterae.5